MASLIVAWVVLVLGALSTTVGLMVAIVTALRPEPRPAGAVTWEPITKFLEIIKGILEALGKLPAAVQFIVLGAVFLSGGAWLMTARPF